MNKSATGTEVLPLLSNSNCHPMKGFPEHSCCFQPLGKKKWMASIVTQKWDGLLLEKMPVKCAKETKKPRNQMGKKGRGK